jgi:hypothetical protein
MPSILKRYPTNDSYAAASLEEIIGKDRLTGMRRFAATEFRSGTFLSQPGGKFVFAPLPHIAQIAPLQGMVAGDFDGDGHADIYAVQNSYAPIPLNGHFDGGIIQLLLGDGHGNFSPVSPRDSGLIVSGDAKALVVLDLNGDGLPDFLVSRNNSRTIAFQNNGQPGHKSLRISLRGRGGNPTAVGSRLTLQLSDGTTETSEIYSGGGYSSQSTAACFFGYPESNPPQKLKVRWPSGKESEHTFGNLSPTPVVSEP